MESGKAEQKEPVDNREVKIFVDGLGETTAKLINGRLFGNDIDMGTPEEFTGRGGMNYILDDDVREMQAKIREACKSQPEIRQIERPAWIAGEIFVERKCQDAKYGGPAHDDRYSRYEWRDLIWRYGSIEGRVAKTETPEEFEKRMIRVAALAMAAIQASRRKRS